MARVRVRDLPVEDARQDEADAGTADAADEGEHPLERGHRQGRDVR